MKCEKLSGSDVKAVGVNRKIVSVNFLKLSFFAALAIFAIVLTIAVLAQVAFASSCGYDACDSGCDICDSGCDICDSGCDVCECDICEEGYADCYRCSGNKRQRLWVNDDCTRVWKTIETCVNGCRDGKCLECPKPIGEVSPSRPSDKFEQETVYTTIKVRNVDDESHWFDLYVYVCESDCSGCVDNDCRKMVCDDTHVYVPTGETKYVKCSKFVSETGYYRVKVEYKIDCSSTKRTVYSEKFRVLSYWGCKWDICDPCDRWDRCDTCKEYRCFGNFLQKRYKTEDCEWRWKIVETCPYGCKDEKCILPAQAPKPSSLGEPQIFMRASYEMDKCKLTSFSFSVQNKGKADTFKLKVEGPVATWVDVPSLVEIAEGETKRITAYATVPCDVEPGMHEFTLTAAAKTSDSRIGLINIERPAGLFVLTPFTDLLLVIVVVFVFALAIFYREKIGFARVPTIKSIRKEPEKFKGNC